LNTWRRVPFKFVRCKFAPDKFALAWMDQVKIYTSLITATFMLSSTVQGQSIQNEFLKMSFCFGPKVL
jgi:hypothetical protein